MQKTMAALRKKAYRLYVLEGLTGREVALRVGVSEKTICAWNKKYGWKLQRKKIEGPPAGYLDAVIHLDRYIAHMHPGLYAEIGPAIKSFVKSQLRNHETSH